MEHIVNVIASIIIGASFIALLFLAVLMMKNDVTLDKRIKIIYAIRDYQVRCLYDGTSEEVDWSDMESYDNTLWRLWDWGYTRILPKEKYKIVEPFIAK